MTPIEIAFTQYGTREIAGSNNNPSVLSYFEYIGQDWVKNDEMAWCAAFLNWCLKRAGKQHTGSLLARSFLNYGTNTNTPKFGDIAVFWRESLNSKFGHAGFYVGEDAKNVYVLGGNQGDQVSIAPFPKFQLLAYRTF